MVRRGKWAKSTDPDQPISKTARRAIRERLESMWYYLPLAGKKAKDDVEYVHQLRVCSRRAASALRVFGDLLPYKNQCRLKRMVRKVRRAANGARDLDVLVERLATTDDCGALKPLIRQVKKKRIQAQKPLLKLCKKAKSQYWERHSLGLAKKVRWRGKGQEPVLHEGAKPALLSAEDDFFMAANADLTNVESIHRMRIRGKHLRYTMELLAGAFDETFRHDLYPIFSDVQDRLGEINDHATAASLFEEWKSRADDSSAAKTLDRLITREEELLESTANAFRQWWTPGRIEDLVQRFDMFLSDERIHAARPGDSLSDTSHGENGKSPDHRPVSLGRREPSR